MDFLDNFDIQFGEEEIVPWLGHVRMVDFDVDDDDDDGIEELRNLHMERRQYRLYPRIDYLNLWRCDEFFKRFRIRKDTTAQILNLIFEDLLPKGAYANRYAFVYVLCYQCCNFFLKLYRSRYIQPMLQLLIAVKFYASGTFQINVGDMTSVSRQSVNKIIPRVSLALASLKSRFIKMPTTADDLEAAACDMFAFAKFPKCIGSIDCTHIKIQSPGGPNAEYYRNRKGFFSLNIQTISSSKLEILDVVCRWPGSAHDQTIFNNSKVKAKFENGTFGSYCLVGDQGYANTPYLATPLLNPVTPVEQLYNESCIRTRNCVERKYGVLKRRFPCLCKGLLFKSIGTVQIVIVACSVLHNIAVMQNDHVPMVPELVELCAAAMMDFDDALGPNDGARPANNCIRGDLLTNYFPALVEENR